MPDDFDSVVADRCSAVDDVPVPADLWSRVQFKVLDHMSVQFDEEGMTMIDLETPVPIDVRRKRPKRALVAGLLAAAAAVIGVAVFAVRSSNDPQMITPADTVVTSSTEPEARSLDRAIECEPEGCPWSPELTARAVEVPVAMNCSTEPDCVNLAVSADGRLVALDPTAGTLTWYEDEPRVVPLPAELQQATLLAIGPHDIAYIAIRDYYLAIDPSGAELARVAWTSRQPWPVYATATGLVTAPRSRWPSPNAALDMPWVDLAGNPITDTRPYPTAEVIDAGIEISFGERAWLLVNEPGIRPRALEFLPRSDGGVVIVFDTWSFGQHQPANVDDETPTINLLELSPDGTIERYFVDTAWPPMVLPDGSLIIAHNDQLVGLTPPA